MEESSDIRRNCHAGDGHVISEGVAMRVTVTLEIPGGVSTQVTVTLEISGGVDTRVTVT